MPLKTMRSPSGGVGALWLACLAALCLLGCESPSPTQAPQKRRRPAPGATFVRDGVVVEAPIPRLEPIRSAAPVAGDAAPMSGDRTFFPLAWFPGQRFVAGEDDDAFMLAAPLQARIYPFVQRALQAATQTAVAVSPGGAYLALLQAGQLSVIDGARGVDTLQRASARSGPIALANDALYVADGATLSATALPSGEPLWTEALGEGAASARITALIVAPGGPIAVLSAGRRHSFVQVTGPGQRVSSAPSLEAGLVVALSPVEGVGLVAAIEGDGRAQLLLLGAGLQERWRAPLEMTPRLPPTCGALRCVVEQGGRGVLFSLEDGAQLADLDLRAASDPGMAASFMTGLVATPREVLVRLSEGEGRGTLAAFDSAGQLSWRHPLGAGQGLAASVDGRYLWAQTERAAGVGARYALSVIDRDLPGAHGRAPSSVHLSHRGWLGPAHLSDDGLWAAVIEAGGEPQAVGAAAAPARALLLR